MVLVQQPERALKSFMKRRDFLKYIMTASGLLVLEEAIRPAKFIFDYGANQV